MKAITMDRDFDYHPHPAQTIIYKAGATYERVPEAAVREIVEAGAGKIVSSAGRRDAVR